MKHFFFRWVVMFLAAIPVLGITPEAIAQDPPLSELETALSQRAWEEANDITRKFIIETVFSVMHEPIQMENLTCRTFRSMDWMWRQYSNHHFGFSVQGEQIPWPPLMSSSSSDLEESNSLDEAIRNDSLVNAWGDHLGWYDPVPLRDENFRWERPSIFDWDLSNEVIYNLSAPRGHLPWIGEDVDHIAGADKPTCGVCAYDAVHLQHHRYYMYLRALWKHLETCELR